VAALSANATPIPIIARPGNSHTIDGPMANGADPSRQPDMPIRMAGRRPVWSENLPKTMSITASAAG
jgi:hypothetical protein